MSLWASLDPKCTALYIGKNYSIFKQFFPCYKHFFSIKNLKLYFLNVNLTCSLHGRPFVVRASNWQLNKLGCYITMYAPIARSGVLGRRNWTTINLLGNISIHNAARSRLSSQMAELCKDWICQTICLKTACWFVRKKMFHLNYWPWCGGGDSVKKTISQRRKKGSVEKMHSPTVVWESSLGPLVCW